MYTFPRISRDNIGVQVYIYTKGSSIHDVTVRGVTDFVTAIQKDYY